MPARAALDGLVRVPTYLSGLYTLAAAVIAVGIVGDVAVAHGAARGTAELIVGAGLLAAGVAGRLRERDEP